MEEAPVSDSPFAHNTFPEDKKSVAIRIAAADFVMLFLCLRVFMCKKNILQKLLSAVSIPTFRTNKHNISQKSIADDIRRNVNCAFVSSLNAPC
jgi:hypothetical protein